MESAQKLAGVIPQEALATTPILQGFLVVPSYALVRFGEWDRILNEPEPRHQTPFTMGVWRYARAMALAATNQLEAAERELAALRQLVADPALKGQTTFSTNTGYAILRIAPEVVAGEIAARRQHWDSALLHLERAVRYEDGLNFQEPHDWHAPVRQNLAAVLMAAGRPDEAEAVYWEDLRKNPENGWSLFGLARALEAQGKHDDAAPIRARFTKAWQDADAPPAPVVPVTRERRR